MSRELYCNDVPTKLSSAVTSSGQTTFNVTSGLDFPKVGNFRILIGTEICIVTAVTFNSFVPATWTVLRAQEGTTATTYSSGTAVNFIVTSQSLTNILHDRTATGTSATATTTITPPRKGDMFFPTDTFYTMVVFDGSAWRFMFNGRQLNPPVFNSSFSGTTWFSEAPDTNISTDLTHVGAIQYDPTPSGTIHSSYTAAPSTPYKFTVAINPHIYYSGSNRCGIGWRSSTGQYVSFTVGIESGSWVHSMYTWNSISSFSGTFFDIGIPPMLVHGPLTWLRIEDTGVNRNAYISSNGINFTLIHTVSRTNFMTPDNIAVILDTGSNVNTGQTILHMDHS